jgi:hypothetical protein
MFAVPTRHRVGTAPGGDRKRRWAMPRRPSSRLLPGLGRNTLFSALIGFVLVTTLAAALLRVDARGGSGFQRLDVLLYAAVAYVVVLPLLGWVGLRLLGARSGWLVIIVSEVILVLEFKFFVNTGPTHSAAWVYGIQGASSYGLAAILVGTGSALRRRAQSRGRTVGGQGDQNPVG